MIDVARRYWRLKKSPEACPFVIFNNRAFLIEFKRFDPETGLELLPPEQQVVTLEEILEYKTELIETLQGIDEMLKLVPTEMTSVISD